MPIAGPAFTDPETSQPGPGQSPRRHGTIFKVTAVILVFAVALNPRAIEMALTVLTVVVLVGFLLVVRALWRTLRRPIGSLTVLDLALGSLIRRWWHHTRSR
jgi:hypothetical protein